MDHLHITGGLTQPKITKSLYKIGLNAVVKSTDKSILNPSASDGLADREQK